MTPRRSTSPTRSAGQLSRDRVLDAAVALVDEHGHEKLTMRMLASSLGVDPMAAYHYVPHKSALFDALVERAWSAVPVDQIDIDGDPAEQLVGAFGIVYDRLIAHPRLLPLVATRSVATTPALALVERGLALLSRVDALEPAEALQLLNALAAFTIGRALAEAAPSVGGQSMDTVVELARTFPLLAAATAAPPATTRDPLNRGLQGILVSWGVSRPLTG